MYILTIPVYRNGVLNRFPFEVFVNEKYISKWKSDGLNIEKATKANSLSGVRPIWCAIDVRGKTREWVFEVWVDPKDMEKYISSGVQIGEIVNTVPQWWVNLGLPVKLWCLLQDKHLVW